MKITMKNRLGGGRTSQVGYADPVYITPIGRRVRFSKIAFDGMVEVMDDAGKKLPDLWHQSQVVAC